MRHLGARLGLGSLSWKRHKRTHSFPESLLTGGLLTDSRETVASAEHELKEGSARSDGEALATDLSSLATSVVSKRRGKKQIERYSSQFGLDEQENVLKVCPCFLVSELLIQGCLIVTERHVCFHSSMFGMKKRKKIKFEEIVQISKEKVFALFPTGIGVRTRTEKVTFSSATSRDRLLQLLRQQQQRVASSVATETDPSADGTAGALAAPVTADGWTCGTQSPSARSCITLATRDSPRDSSLANQNPDTSSILAETSVTAVTATELLSPADPRLSATHGDSRNSCFSRVDQIEMRPHPTVVPRERTNQYSNSVSKRLLRGKTADSEVSRKQKWLQKVLLVFVVAILAVLAITGALLSVRLDGMERQLMLGADSAEQRQNNADQK